jgi:hypothetical protein
MNEHIKQTEDVLEAGRREVRAAAEASMQNAREGFSQASKLAANGTEIWRQVVLSSSAGAKELTGKCLENTAANMEATLEAARALATSKTIPEAASIYTDFVTKQLATTTEQAQELLTLSSEVYSRMLDRTRSAA